MSARTRRLAVGALVPFLVAAGPSEAVQLSLDDAVEAALVRGYAIRLSAIDQEQAEQDVRAGWSSVYPKVDASLSYTRTLLTPNPFAGSDAAALFGGLGTSDWLTFNERYRSNPGDQATLAAAVQRNCPGAALGMEGLSFADYIGCVQSAQQGARVPAVDSDANPFLVENNLRAGLSVSQLVFSQSVFAGLAASDLAEEVAKLSRQRVGQTVVRDVTAAYYGLLLARASVEVLQKSVERSRATADEVRSRVREGVVPQFQLLSAEVELANLETRLVSARDEAAAAQDGLALAIGLEVGTRIEPTDPLAMPDAPPAIDDPEAATEAALEQRPDVAAAETMITLNQKAEEATFGRYLPELRLVANLAAVGNVPDDRRRFFVEPAMGDELLPPDPFAYGSEEPGFFDESYWGTNLTAGLNLTWNLFEGFATSAQLEKDRLEVERARVQRELLGQQVRQEVLTQWRNLRSALERVRVQAKNVARAELNYRHAELRVKEGVSTQLELREASSQLDQSRFNQLQAIHDYLVALTSYRVALGDPVETEE